jgi:co-chaperonin GroES (HSP10)
MLHPKRNYISFRDIEQATTNAGLVVPGEILTNRAEVIAAGPGKYLPTGGFRETHVKPGDLIMIAPNAYVHMLLVNGEIVKVVEDDFIIATIDPEDVIQKPKAEKKEEPKVQLVGVN